MNKYKQRRSLFFFILFTTFFCLTMTNITLAGGIKERMKARVPAINNLKSQGIVGENNTGFLEFRIDKADQQQLVKDENADRSKVYQAIAKQQGSSATLVASRRTKQIVSKAIPGTWLQKTDGSWYQK
jgi:uncharacterized protein